MCSLVSACRISQVREASYPEVCGSERETVTPPDGMGILIFGDSGYTRQDERDGLEQSTELAGVSGLPTRNR
jgi:hypothetical protein